MITGIVKAVRELVNQLHSHLVSYQPTFGTQLANEYCFTLSNTNITSEIKVCMCVCVCVCVHVCVHACVHVGRSHEFLGSQAKLTTAI